MEKRKYETWREYMRRVKKQEKKEKWRFIIGILVGVAFFAMLFLRAMAWDNYFNIL